MKHFRTDIIIFIALLVPAAIVFATTSGQSVIDIQLHDTYFVLDKTTAAVLMIGPPMFLIFFIRALIQKFKTIGPNVGLMMGLIILASITYRAVLLEQSDLHELMRTADEQQIADHKITVNWALGVFGLWTAIFLLLAYRTIKIAKAIKSGQS